MKRSKLGLNDAKNLFQDSKQLKIIEPQHNLKILVFFLSINKHEFTSSQ